MKRFALLSTLLSVTFGCSYDFEIRYFSTDSPSLSELYRHADGKTMRVSSADKEFEGNNDYRLIKAGTELTLANIDGPAIIRHIWMTSGCSQKRYTRMLTLRMYWDNAKTPCVEAPYGDFFAVGHGLQTNVDSEPITVSANGRAVNTFFPMPFYKNARITITNEAKKDVGLYYYIDYQKYENLPIESLHFHAQYRQEYPGSENREYLLLEATGRGQYVGTVYNIQQTMRAWWGEGDDFFTIDGETEPSIRGTGSEDYISQAWGVRKENHAMLGTTISEGFEVGCRHTVYRWHIQDPISFQKSLRFTIEHTGATFNKKEEFQKWYDVRREHYSSVAYWYQSEPHKRFTDIPPAKDRFPTRQIATIEAEDLLEKKTEIPRLTDSQGPDPRVVNEGIFGNSGNKKHLLLPARQPEDEMEIVFAVPEDGIYLITAAMNRGPEYGTAKILLNENPSQRTFQGFHASDKFPAEHFVRGTFLTKGEHKLRFVSIGKHSEATNAWIGVDQIIIEQYKN